MKDKRLPGTIHSVAQAIRDAGGKAEGIYMDMREPESIAAGVAKTVETFGRLDIVVNNAAILVPGTIETIQPRHIDLIWQVDLRGPILLMREAIPHMRKQGGGRIINVSSVAGVFPGPGPYKEARRGGAFYGMVKAGLERLSQGLAMELQDDKITVNVLSPQGRIKTPGNLFAQNDPENPNLDFEPAFAMAKGARWICEQGPEFTGNILFDEDLAREKGLL
ncbi:MAG: SDR family NAD(P)-dependent oxidoreductase [Dehalococcoidia bacterium]|nr:SDR family NAD(P)-dependent oxidoreductase [Dehalococcoidia bacterium]